MKTATPASDVLAPQEQVADLGRARPRPRPGSSPASTSTRIPRGRAVEPERLRQRRRRHPASAPRRCPSRDRLDLLAREVRQVDAQVVEEARPALRIPSRSPSRPSASNVLTMRTTQVPPARASISDLGRERRGATLAPAALLVRERAAAAERPGRDGGRRPRPTWKTTAPPSRSSTSVGHEPGAESPRPVAIASQTSSGVPGTSTLDLDRRDAGLRGSSVMASPPMPVADGRRRPAGAARRRAVVACVASDKVVSAMRQLVGERAALGRATAKRISASIDSVASSLPARRARATSVADLADGARGERRSGSPPKAVARCRRRVGGAATPSAPGDTTYDVAVATSRRSVRPPQRRCLRPSSHEPVRPRARAGGS